jgi:putative proteasome-type protease
VHIFEQPGDRVLVLQSSGNLSLTHSALALIEEDIALWRSHPEHPSLLNQPSMFETARYVGHKIREVDKAERQALEKDEFRFNIHFLVGGQIGKLPHQIYYVYPQGNVIHASEDSPFLQIGESKYGKPIWIAASNTPRPWPRRRATACCRWIRR